MKQILNPYVSRALVRRWPFRGQNRIANLLGLNFASLPDGDLVEAEDGRRFKIHSDGMYWRLFLDGTYNAEETDMMRRLVGKGDIVADIGANFGWYTTLFSKCVGENGHVFAFEPTPTIHAELREHIALNDCTSNVTLNDCGLGNMRSEKTIFTFKGLPHGHSSLSTLGREDTVASEINIVTLDEYINENNIARIDWAKIDVEGSEMMVLEGAKNLLASNNAPMWIIEMNQVTSGAFGYNPQDLLNYLVDQAQYDSFIVFRDDKFSQLEQFDDVNHGEMVICAKRLIHSERISGILC